MPTSTHKTVSTLKVCTYLSLKPTTRQYLISSHCARTIKPGMSHRTAVTVIVTELLYRFKRICGTSSFFPRWYCRHLFVYLFYLTKLSTGYNTKHQMIWRKWKMNWKYWGKTQPQPNLKYYPSICLLKLRGKKNKKNCTQDCQSLGQEWNFTLPKYSAYPHLIRQTNHTADKQKIFSFTFTLSIFKYVSHAGKIWT